MKRLRGVCLGRSRLVRLCRRLFLRRRRRRLPTVRLGEERRRGGLLGWCRRLCSGDQRPKEEVQEKRPKAVAAAPKGHLVVYVGREGEVAPARFVVPVVHFNHPLFAELLREAEREFGFHHPGGITLPCPVSDFESVRTRVAAARGRKSHVKNRSWFAL